MSEGKLKIKEIIQDDIAQLELDIEKSENQQTEEVELKFLETVQNEFVRKASKDFDNHLKNYVTKNLKELGFEFQSEADFIQFVSKRVTRIAFEDKPNEYELYVDYQTDNQKLIGIYNDKASFSYEGNKVTATFGRNIA